MPSDEELGRMFLAMRAAIAKRAGVGVGEVLCGASLVNQPLNLTSEQRAQLADPFQKAAREIDKKAKVSASETSKLDKVLAAYNLVAGKVGVTKKLTCENSPPIPMDGVAGIRAIKALLLCLGWAFAPTTELQSQSLAQTIWRSLEIRQNVDVKNYVAQNATLSAVDPDSGATSFTAGLGVLFDVWSASRFTLGGTGEYNRNTTIAKPQNQWSAGARAEVLFPRLVSMDPIARLDVKYGRDVVAGTKSAKAVLLLTATADGHTCLPNTTIELVPSLPLSLVYSPYLGLELESRTGGTTAGDFVRGVGRLDAALRLGQPSSPLLELTSTNAFRHDYRDLSVPSGRSTQFQTVSGTWFFGRTPRSLVGLSVSRIWGEDPTKGFARQAFTQLSLAVRISRAP